MFTGLFKNYIHPIFIMIVSIVGVGFLPLPYLALQVGIIPMFFYLAILTVLIICLHVMFGVVALHTPDLKRFPGFVGFYFGKPLEILAFFLMMVGMYGALLVYIIIGLDFLATLLTVQDVFWMERLSLQNLWVPANQTGLAAALLVCGPIIFSLWGVGMIPDIEEQVHSNKKLLYKSIIIGTCIPAVLYAVFTVIVLAITGEHTALSALKGWTVILGLITTCMAFVVQGNMLREIFLYDLGVSRTGALLAAFLPPLILFVLGVTQFIPVVSFVGTILLPMNALLIIGMYFKVRKKT